jgi:CheY-like chemotaxis protein
MPVMDGWTLMRVLQLDPTYTQFPVVAFSANIQGELPGAVATFRKAAVDPEVLLDVIDRACRYDVPVKSPGPGHRLN